MFDKTAISIEQIRSKRFNVTENDNAAHYLSHISYYRLGEYWHSMQDDKKHLFKQNSKFKDVISLYNFDAELRILLFRLLKNRNKLKNKINLSPLSRI
jgi:abortive infection bacteriophage resistance protein